VSATSASVTAPGYQNAVYESAPAPDPFVLDNGDAHNDYWAFSTGDRFPILHSSDLVHWVSAGTAMSSRPSWVLRSGDWHPWSPSVVALGGRFVMYYTGLVATPRQTPNLTNCIGIATASNPGGPYVDHGPLDLIAGATPGRPLGCGDASSQGNIDPAPFIDDDGQAYLYVSTDFDCSSGICKLQPTISAIPLAADLLHAIGPRVPLFSGSQPWEQGPAAPTVEGPAMVKHDGLYYLLYSGGNWQGSYAMGYATAPTPLGPFTKHAGNPIMSATSSVLSPGGGGSPLTGPRGGLWIAYHGRDWSYANPRTLRIDPFPWQASAPGEPDIAAIAGPTSDPQPTVP